MNEPILDYLKVGIVQFLAYPSTMQGDGPVLETVSALASDSFFDAIEITHISNPNVRAEVAALLQRSRVEPYFCAQPLTMLPGLNLEDADEAARRKAVAAVKAGIDEAVEVGAKYVTTMSGKKTPDKRRATTRLVESLKELCAYAAPHGIALSLEAFDDVPYGKNCLIGPTPEAVAVSERVRKSYPNFGLLLDLAHLCLLREDIGEALRTAGDHLVHVHLATAADDDPSNPYYGDNHPYFGAAGTCNDVPQVVECLRTLLGMGFASKERRGIVSFEIKPDYANGDTPEGIVAGAKRTLAAAWAQV